MLLAETILLAAMSTCPSQDAWLRGDRLDKEQRAAMRDRVLRTCEEMGATQEACSVVDAIAVRESSWDACAVHVLGPNEYGLGAHGLSWRWHRRKWYSDETDQDPNVFRIPEVSTVVTLRLMRQAARRSDVRTWADLNEVFAGRISLRERDRGRMARFCHRLKGHGVDCRKSPKGKLGEVLGTKPTEDQEDFVVAMMEGNSA